MALESAVDLSRGVASLVDGLRLPGSVVDARDLQLMRELPAPDETTAAWANLLSDHGATDMWVQLARGHGERAGPEQAKLATDLLREMRRHAREVRSFADDLFDRPRPFERDPSLVTYTHRPTTGSFPSGHTIGFYSNARVMSTIDPANADAYWWLAKEGAAARVIGRVHHPTDLVAGAELGVRAARRVLEARGFRAVVAPNPAVLLERSAYASFGTDPVGIARIAALMPRDVRSAADTPDGALQAWFGAREFDNALVF